MMQKINKKHYSRALWGIFASECLHFRGKSDFKMFLNGFQINVFCLKKEETHSLATVQQCMSTQVIQTENNVRGKTTASHLLLTNESNKTTNFK